MVVVCEVGFWVLLAAGLALRYLAKMPRAGLAVLLCEPLLELTLLVLTAIELRGGAESSWQHGLAAVYIGFTVAYGHYMIRWADARFAHRFAGGPKPVGPPKYGRERARHEWMLTVRTGLAALVSVVLLQAAVWWVGDPGRTATLVGWQARMLWVTGIYAAIAASYTLWPKKEPAR